MQSNPTSSQEPDPGRVSDLKDHNTAAAAPQRARQAGQTASDLLDKGAEALSQAYNQATDTVNDTVQQAVTYGKQAVSYGRENPGKAALVAFGAGIGIGILIASSVNSRTRTTRIVTPVLSAITEIAAEIFR